MSSRPGETKEVTVYELSASKDVSSHPPKLWLADLPGYGFAYTSQEQSERYHNLVTTFLCHKKERPRRVLLLLDARHGLKQTDRIFLQNLEHYGDLPPIQIVLTKCDLVEATELARRFTKVQQDVNDSLRRQPSNLPVLLTSASRHNGILTVQKELAGLVGRKG
jgi:GTP-binding protein